VGALAQMPEVEPELRHLVLDLQIGKEIGQHFGTNPRVAVINPG